MLLSNKLKILGIILLSVIVFGCAKTQQAPLPVGSLKIGVANFTHPETNADMLAGYISDQTKEIDTKVFNYLDNAFADVLRTKTSRSYTPAYQAQECSRRIADAQNQPKAAIRRWSEVGRCMGVDLLVIPQVYEWHARDGGSAGVVTPARIVLGFFVIDTRTETLVSRSHFEETQQSLSSNILEAGKFFKRSGKWVTAEELAIEAMAKAIEDLRL